MATTSLGPAWKAPVTSVSSRLVDRRLRATAEVSWSELFWAVTSQVERPVSRAMEAGSQVWVRLTSPWVRKKATGRCRSRPRLWLLRSIRPKYWPTAALGAEIRIRRRIRPPGARLKLEGVTVISAPAGAWVVTRR